MSVGYTAFSDESGLAERYLVFGGILLPTGLIDEAERVLSAFCARSGFGSREMSWKKCSKAEVNRYVHFAELLWTLNEQVCAVDFRSLVIDTRRNSLRAGEFKCATDEAGFYKFYHFFLTKSFALVAPHADEYEVIAGSASDQYPYRTEILSNTVAGALRKHFGEEVDVREVLRASPAQTRLHQLADVLLGAVSFRFNRYDKNASKVAICSSIEHRLGRALNTDFRPSTRPFNVWTFTGIGQSRWVPGSAGRV
jgi:hypothetical protein